MKERCGDNGDFGHTNLWGTPYLMFGVSCDLEKNHKGPHQGYEELRIKPSHEPNGRKIKIDSVKIVPARVQVSWENE